MKHVVWTNKQLCVPAHNAPSIQVPVLKSASFEGTAAMSRRRASRFFAGSFHNSARFVPGFVRSESVFPTMDGVPPSHVDACEASASFDTCNFLGTLNAMRVTSV